MVTECTFPWGLMRDAMELSRCLKKLFHISPFDLHLGFLDVFEQVGILRIGREEKTMTSFVSGLRGPSAIILITLEWMDMHIRSECGLLRKVRLGRKRGHTLSPSGYHGYCLEFCAAPYHNSQ
jgi:hypothetical protein